MGARVGWSQSNSCWSELTDHTFVALLSMAVDCSRPRWTWTWQMVDLKLSGIWPLLLPPWICGICLTPSFGGVVEFGGSSTVNKSVFDADALAELWQYACNAVLLTQVQDTLSSYILQQHCGNVWSDCAVQQAENRGMLFEQSFREGDKKNYFFSSFFTTKGS